MEHKKILEEWFKAIKQPAPINSKERQAFKSPVFGMRYGTDQKIK